jgi:putative copper export protein
LVLGFFVTAGFLLPGSEPEPLRRTLAIRACRFLIIFLCASVSALLIQGAKLQRGELPSLEILSRYLTATQSGNVWLIRACYAIALALLGFSITRGTVRLHGIRWLALLSLPLIASRSLTSHAIAVKTQTSWVIAADAVHLIATALWAGGLVAVFTIARASRHQANLNPVWLAQFINRFSRLAFASVALLFCAGLYLSWVHVGSLTTLVATDSGKVLIVKLGLFAAMLALGAVNFLSTRPAIRDMAHANVRNNSLVDKATKRIAVESMLGLAIFATTGYLTVLPPGVHAVHAARQNVPPAQPPALQPAQGASVKIIAPVNHQSVTGDRVELRFKLTKGNRGHHAHAYIDGELVGMFEGNEGTLNGIKPGKHTLEVRVVADDHQTELDASDKVVFTAK